MIELDWSFGHPRPRWDHSISHLKNDKNGPQEGSRDKFTWHHVQTVLTKNNMILIQLNATTLSLEINVTCSCCRLTIKELFNKKITTFDNWGIIWSWTQRYELGHWVHYKGPKFGNSCQWTHWPMHERPLAKKKERQKDYHLEILWNNRPSVIVWG